MGESNERKDVTHKSFRGNPDYKTEFTAAVDEIIAANMSDRQVRIGVIDKLCEEYTAEVGETPDSWQLQRLANEILREELTDRHPDKMTRNEYPIISIRQLNRRDQREASFKFTEEYGIDGKFHGIPTRRYKKY